MITKTTNFGFLLSTALYGFYLIGSPSTKQSNITIFWDIHDVFLCRDAREVLSILWNDKNTWKALTHTNVRLFGGSIKLLWKYMTDEASTEQFVQLAQKENNPYFIEFMKKVCNAQKPIEGTVSIIKELHANGYTHHIGSNIGHTIFNDLIDPKKYPQFADIFSCFELDKSHIVTYNNGILIRKPHEQYFRDYLKKNNIDPKKTRIIFVDDRTKNVEAACKSGLEAIHFKNPEQLRKDMLGLKLKLNTNPLQKSEPTTNDRK